MPRNCYLCLKSLCKLTISSGNKNILKSQQLLVKKCGNPVYDHCAMNGHNSMCSFLWMVSHFMHWLKVWEWNEIPTEVWLMLYTNFNCTWKALPVIHRLNRYLVDRLFLVNCFQRSQAGFNYLIECLFAKQVSASNG